MRYRSVREFLAVVGIGLLAVLAPITPLGLGIGPFDVVTIGMPLALLLSAPYLIGEYRSMPSGRRFGLVLPATAFMLAGLLSVIGNAETPEPLLTLIRYGFYLALIITVGRVTRRPEARRAVLWTLAISGALTLAYAAYQFIRPSKSIGMSELVGLARTRVFSTFDNPNFYGEFLVLLIPVLVCLVAIERGPRRVFAALLTVAGFAALLLTYTRGSWLALAAGLALAMYMVKMRQRWSIVALVPLIMIIVPGVMQRILSIFSLEGTATFRLHLWRIAGEVIATHPLFGVGIGRFYDGFRQAVIDNPRLAIGYLEYGAHNSYLTVTAEAGVVGGLAFAWLVFEIVRRGLYLSKADLPKRQQIENATLTAGLLAFAINAMTSNAFQHPKGAVFFWLLAGVQLGVQLDVASARELAPVGHTAIELFRRSLSGRIALRTSTALTHAYRASATASAAQGFGRVWRASLIGRAIGSFERGPAEDREAVAGGVVANSLFVRGLSWVGRRGFAVWEQSAARRLVYSPAPEAEGLWAASRFGRRFLRLHPPGELG